jgi:hypothetical protein
VRGEMHNPVLSKFPARYLRQSSIEVECFHALIRPCP